MRLWPFTESDRLKNIRITAALNKMVSNETEPLDVRINAVRALGAAGFDNPAINVELTLTTAASMRDEKYAQLKFYSIRGVRRNEQAK